jgi:hypothetical protein
MERSRAHVSPQTMRAQAARSRIAIVRLDLARIMPPLGAIM